MGMQATTSVTGPTLAIVSTPYRAALTQVLTDLVHPVGSTRQSKCQTCLAGKIGVLSQQSLVRSER